MGDTLADVYLKIQGVTGECSDVGHPGKDGWIEICSFSFGFAFESGSASKSAPAAAPKPAKGGAGGKGAAARGDDSNAPNKHITFSKKPNQCSTQLAQMCYDGTEVDTVTFEACRYGAASLQNAKIPFLNLVFKKVTFKKSSMQISNEGMPTESLEFAYDTVTMTTIWTDNATGDRMPGGQCQVGWDFVNNKPAT